MKSKDVPLGFLKVSTDPQIAIEYLSQLSFPATRHVIFPVDDHYTGFINNCRDYADYAVSLATCFKSKFVRIVASKERIWLGAAGREILQYEGNIFDLYGGDGKLIRSVTCLDDGGSWAFCEHGTRHPVETSFPYGSRRKRDRFTSEHLRKLVDAYGIPWLTGSSLLAAGEYYLFESEQAPISTCTIAEADDPAYGYYVRGLSWLPHMETHASSVVADFERCISINPVYESRVREALNNARRILSQE
jgi:hypothetical protein